MPAPPQCECGRPVPHSPHERGWPVQAGSAVLLATLEANTERLFVSFVEPQCGQGVPFRWVERTRISLSWLHFSQ